MTKNIIIGPGYPLRGGISHSNNILCNEFNVNNIDSEIISFSLQYPSLLFPGKTQYEDTELIYKIKISSIINSIFPLNWIFVFWRVLKSKPDYVILRYWMPFMAPCLGSIAYLIKWFSKVKVIALIDNVKPHEKRMGDFLLNKYFFNSCHAYVTFSKGVLNDLKKYSGNKKTASIPLPIYNNFGQIVDKKDAKLKLNLNENKKYLLFFGLVRKYKGLDLLIDSLMLIHKHDKDIVLLIAGEFYDDINYYKNKIKSLGLNENVIIHNRFIKEDEVKYFFCACDLVVQPYKTATQSGITQIAYNFHKPMLVTDVGSLSETVNHEKGGYVVNYDSVEIKEYILDYYNNKRESSFSENVEKEKLKFNWINLVEGINNIYKKI